MTRWIAPLGPVLLGVTLACQTAPNSAARMDSDMPTRDHSSFADPTTFDTTHLVLDLTVDFATSTLAGTAELQLERRQPEATELILDTRALDVQRVEAASSTTTWSDTSYRLDPPHEAFGSALRVAMPPDADRVRITYATSPDATGLQWLSPPQTAGRRHPFLFSQAQAIHARSFVPVQDTPGVRATYEATLRVPPDLVAVMAARQEGSEPERGLYRFRMPQPIPSYLIALAVGDLEFRPMDERTGVWAEPSVVDAAAEEFSDTEAMIETTESLYGPYRWDRYDLLVLPPSFPFGGMENPRLTFATPTVITGDKSLVSLVAHELAHSWSGNLVTNATWEDFWLNEGFTTYLERRIIEAVYGTRRADMEWVLGVESLAEARRTLPVARDRTLQPDLTDRDPDDAFSNVPYEQGALFLSSLEAAFGREAFDAFLRRWFDDHAFESVTTDDFLDTLRAQLLPVDPAAMPDMVLQEWLTGEAVPASARLPTSDAFRSVAAARDAWLAGGSVPELADEARAWSTHEWLHFLNTLPRRFETTQLGALDDQFGLTASSNAEIAHAWFRLTIANRYQPADEALARYLIGIGRRKLIVPLYRDLAATSDGLATARRIYAQAREGYHPLAQRTIDEFLEDGGAGTSNEP